MRTIRYMKEMQCINESDIIGSVLDEHIICHNHGNIQQCGFFYLAEIRQTPILILPMVSKEPENRMVGEGNYEYFINVMADMIQKYSPEIEIEMEKDNE